LETLVKVVSLYKSFKKNSRIIEVLKDINLTISKGETVAVLGKSGAGKSTLLHLLGSLDSPSSGQIFFDGSEITSLNEDAVSILRGSKIGFVFQFHYLINEITTFENVIIPGIINKFNKKDILDRADYLIDKLGLSHRKTHKPSELSGGEQQRVAIARALINNPRILMADEPTGNLDTKTSIATFDLLEKIHIENKMSMLVVTHNLELSERFDRKIILEDGQIVKEYN